MRKQLKQLSLRTERVMSLSAMKSVKGGITLYCNFTKAAPQPPQWGTTLATEPTINGSAQGATQSC